jgi:hypothetical protein
VNNRPTVTTTSASPTVAKQTASTAVDRLRGTAAPTVYSANASAALGAAPA